MTKAIKTLFGAIHLTWPRLIVIIMAVSILLTACADHSDNQNVVFEDMEAAFEQADLLSANIGLFSKTVSGDAISYGECGTGANTRTGLKSMATLV